MGSRHGGWRRRCCGKATLNSDPSSERSQAGGAPKRGGPKRWTAAALLVFAAATISLFHVYGGEDLEVSVPTSERRWAGMAPGERAWAPIADSDLRFVVWLIARNARILASRPWDLFEAEPCHPAQRTLAYGEPAITVGLLGVPAELLFGDPVLTYNIVLPAITLIAALAMFLLVREWTAVPAAGIAAGLLYAFHAIKLANLVHVYAWDNAWTLLALWFATRLFATGRWRDAFGLGISVCLQMGGSFYPQVAAVVIGAPLLIWLVAHYGTRRLRAGPCALIVALAIGGGTLLLGPYLGHRDAGLLQERLLQTFLSHDWMRPSSPLFPGWAVLGLASAAFALGRSRAVGAGRGDPRWALLAGAVLASYLAAGGNLGDRVAAHLNDQPVPPALPNLYAALAAVIPGLDVVRVPARIFSGTHVAFCLLAGLGAAALIRLAPRRFTAAAAAVVIALTYVDTLRPRTLGFEPKLTFEMREIRPPQQDLVFFRELAALGNSGPILEVPVKPKYVARGSASILLSAYHQRRTSQCYSSFYPRELQEVKAIADRLPDEAALAAARRLGFTTLLVHHPPKEILLRPLQRSFERFAAGRGSTRLHRLHGNDSMTAYAIKGDDDTGS